MFERYTEKQNAHDLSSGRAAVKSVRKAPRVWQGRLGLAALAQISK